MFYLWISVDRGDLICLIDTGISRMNMGKLGNEDN